MAAPGAARSLLLGSAARSLLVTVVNVGLGYLTTVVSTRVLTPSELGVYSFLLSVVTVATLPAAMGLPALILREVAAASVSARWEAVKGLLLRTHQFAAVTSGGMGLLLLGVHLSWPAWLPGCDTPSVVAGMVLMPAIALTGLRSAAVRGLHRVALGQLPDQVVKPALLLVALVALGGNGAATTASALWANVAATMIATGVGYSTFLWLRPFEWGAVRAEYHDRAWASSVLPLGLSAGMSVVSAHAGTIVLGLLAPASEVASFRIASQLSLVAGVAYTAVNAVLHPRLAQAHARGDLPAAERLGVRGARVATAAALAVLVVVAVGGRPLLVALFGEAYAAALVPTVWLALGHVVNAAAGFPAAVLNMGRREQKVTRAFAVATGVQVVLTPIGVSVAGAPGAAVATVVVTAVLNGLLWWSSRAELGVDTAAWARSSRAGR